MKCPKCGTEYDDGDKFCRSCGAQLASDNNENTKPPEDAPADKNIPSRLISQGKIFKYSIKAIFGAFIVLTLFIYLLPMDFMSNVYAYVGQGHYMSGLDGNWEDSYFIMKLLVNIFSDIDLTRTPCAVMMLLSITGVTFLIAWVIVSFAKYAREKYLKAMFKPELTFVAIYTVFVIASSIAIANQNRYYMPAGTATVALLLLSLLCLFASVTIYILRKRFFDSHSELIVALNIIG